MACFDWLCAAQASFEGSLICLFQTSPESPLIFVLLQRLFASQPIDQLKDSAKAAGVDA